MMSKLSDNGSRNSARRGVALIMVLGMIALLMILGVAFSISMRTERMSANYYVHQLRGEHLGHVAVARAASEVQGNLGDDVYPDWVVRGSRDSGIACETLLTDTIRASVPDVLLERVEELLNEGGVEWVAAPDGLGAYAYAIVNVSGLLDANHAGGAPRRFGASAAEIDLAELPEMNNAAAFTGMRANPGTPSRYETLPEVEYWHYRLAGPGGQSYGGLSGPPASMHVRPPAPLGRRDGDGIARLDQVLVGDATAATLVSNRNAVVSALNRSGISGDAALRWPLIDKTPAEIAFYNLVDYVDDDRLPANLGGTAASDPRIPSVEANPMFNEFEVEYVINVVTNLAGQWTYTVRGRVRFELAWLFPRGLFPATGYTFNHRVNFSSDNPAYADLAAASPAPQSRQIMALPTIGDERFIHFEVDIPQRSITRNDSLPENQVFRINAEVTTWLTDNASGQVVDTNQTLTVTGGLPFSFAGTNTYRVTRGMECIEPRANFFIDIPGFGRNWLLTNPDGAQSSIGFFNHRAIARAEEEESDGVGRFYVAGRPLKAVGELGYLFYGEPWHTIRLYEHVEGGLLHTVLDHFVVTTNHWRFGLVNPNTESRDALAAAFLGMPFSDDPDASTPALSAAQAYAIADAWGNEVRNRGYIRDLSDIGRLRAVFHDTFIADLSEPEKEAIIRNASSLFHHRNNHFIVVVAINTYGVAGLEIGLRRLVAEIWRDPFKDRWDNRNRMYLRLFQWVD